MDIITLVALFAALFIVIGLSEPLAARLRVPFTVVLAVVGGLLGSVAAMLETEWVAAVLGPGAAEILELPIRSALFLYVLLPILLFQVSLELDLRRMADDWVPILLMAVVAVVLTTFAIGFALSPFTVMPLVGCLLLGAIVSTTDPSAVVSVFRDIAAPQRLTRIVEGESLLNDAAAIALFGFFLTFVMAGVPNPTLAHILSTLPVLVLGGVAIGWVAAQICLRGMAMTARFPKAQISFSVALPFVAYLVSEQIVGASGVIAAVTTGLVLNVTGPGRMSPAVWAELRHVWGLLAHWAGALIFVLAALLIPRFLGQAEPSDAGLVLVVIAAALITRAFVLYAMLPVLTRLGLSPQVDPPYRVAILWGGLRGAVTLALALAVTENPLVPSLVKREVGILATAFVLFTLFVQGTTLRAVIRRLGLARLAPLDVALSNQVIAVALQNVREEVAGTMRRDGLNRDIVRAEAKRFGERLEGAVRRAEGGDDIPDRERITLGLVALAGRERDIVLERFRQQILSSRLVQRMVGDADRLIEAARASGRTGYRAAARRSVAEGRRWRLAVALHNRLGLRGPLERLARDRFEVLMNQLLVLHDLHEHIEAKIRRIHGRRVADLLEELLRRRQEELATALDALRLQYPGYSDEMERRFIRRAALRLEEREYETLFDDGLIGPELWRTLNQTLAVQRARLDRPPPLDLAVQKSELVGQFPLFQGMDDEQRRSLARALRTVYVAPGQVLLRKGEIPRNVFFIASGAVESEFAGQRLRLGRGEMFGQLSMLARWSRRGRVMAISHGTLLRLDEARFLRLLRRNTRLQQAVADSARARGVTLDLAAVVAGGPAGLPSASPLEKGPPEEGSAEKGAPGKGAAAAEPDVAAEPAADGADATADTAGRQDGGAADAGAIDARAAEPAAPALSARTPATPPDR
jgi:CPA1 family monovalent cation:H+ antiporter